VKLALLAVLLVATSALAQPADPGEAAYQEGRRYYDLRDWDNAIKKFKEAYKLRSDAPSLFNIAQSYRLKGDCVEAIGFYKTYKRNYPTAQNIAAVDKFIAELEPCAQQQQQSAKTEPTGPTGPANQEGPTAAKYEDHGGGMRTTGMIVGGAGALIVATGFVFGALAKAKSDDITNADPANAQPWDPSIETDGKRYDLLAKISWGVGGAAIVGGVVLFVLGKSSEHVQVSVAPTATTVGYFARW